MVTVSRSLTRTLAERGLQPAVGEDMVSLLQWLDSHGLTNTAGVVDRPSDQAIPGAALVDRGAALAQATSRQSVRPLKQDELKALKERFKGSSLEGISAEAMWAAVVNAEASVRTLAWERLGTGRAQGAAR